MAISCVFGFIGLFWPVFGSLWEPLGCLGCLWTAIGAPFVTYGVPLGHLWRVIWAPFVAFGGQLGRLWGVLGLHLTPVGVH